MNREDPPVQRYLDRFRAVLDAASIGEGERSEILLEIESHIAEARRGGASAAEILDRLGSAEDLARAYAVELLLQPRSGRLRGVRWLFSGLAAIATLVLAVVVGGVSLALLFGGMAGVVVAIVGPFVPPEWFDPTLRAGLPQLVVLLVSLAFAGVGFLLIRILLLNLRLLISAISKAFSR